MTKKTRKKQMHTRKFIQVKNVLRRLLLILIFGIGIMTFKHFGSINFLPWFSKGSFSWPGQNWHAQRVMDPLLDLDYPAQEMTINDGIQLNLPYYNQNDPRWASQRYGTDASQTLAENGCAIVVLAMVEAYFSGEDTNPTHILSWSGDDFYVHEQGTSWSIFSAYGQEFGREVVEIGNHLNRAKEYLENGYAIIVSVGPGHFTQSGHLMLVRGYGPGFVLVNDPNDSLKTKHTLSLISDKLLASDSLNYWAIRAYNFD